MDNTTADHLKNLNSVKNRILGLLSHDLKEIAYSHHLLSEKIHYLLKKGKSEEVLQLGEHIQSQGSKFISLVEKLNLWIQENKDLNVYDYNSIELDKIIGAELSDYIAHSNDTDISKDLNIADFNSIAKNISIK